MIKSFLKVYNFFNFLLVMYSILFSIDSYPRRIKAPFSWRVLILKLKNDLRQCHKPVTIKEGKLISGCGDNGLKNFDLNTYKKFKLSIKDKDILIYNYEEFEDFNGELIHYRYVDKDVVRLFRTVYPIEIHEYCKFQGLSCHELGIENRYPRLSYKDIEKILSKKMYVDIPDKYYSRSEDDVVFSFFRNDLGYYDFKYVVFNKHNKEQPYEVEFSSKNKYEIIIYCLKSKENRDLCKKIEALRPYIKKYDSYL